MDREKCSTSARAAKAKTEAAIAKDITNEPEVSIFSTEELQNPALAKRVNQQLNTQKNNSDTKTDKKTNDEKDAARLERAYKIMGVDDAKKDAVYNALIDLSQGQGIDTKDISGSINRAVGALSKRADKVTDIKDKAKAAVASGTIQSEFAKELADAKGTPYDQQQKYFAKNIGEKDAIRRVLKMPTSYAEAVTMVPRNISGSKNIQTTALGLLYDGKIGQPKYQARLPELKLEDITIGEKTEQADGVYEIETGFIIVENGIIKSKKNLRSKKK